MVLAILEGGARAVYCVDLPEDPSAEWHKVKEYAAKLEGTGGEGRLEYISGDTTKQVRTRSASGRVFRNTNDIISWLR